MKKLSFEIATRLHGSQRWKYIVYCDISDFDYDKSKFDSPVTAFKYAEEHTGEKDDPVMRDIIEWMLCDGQTEDEDNNPYIDWLIELHEESEDHPHDYETVAKVEYCGSDLFQIYPEYYVPYEMKRRAKQKLKEAANKSRERTWEIVENPTSPIRFNDFETKLQTLRDAFIEIGLLTKAECFRAEYGQVVDLSKKNT